MMSGNVMAVCLAVALALCSRMSIAQVAGDTSSLAPEPDDMEEALAGSDPQETEDAILDALNPVMDVSEPLTHGATGEALGQGSAHFTKKSQMSREAARRLFEGKGKGPRVKAFRDKMAKRGGFLKKAGVIVTIAEWWGTTCQIGGRLCEGDGIGALSVLTDKGLETGAGMAGGAAGGTLGPIGAVAGSAAAVEGHKAFISPKIKKWEYDQEYEARKATHLGSRKPRRVFSGGWSTQEAAGGITVSKQGQAVRVNISGAYGKGRVSGSGGGKIAPTGAFSFPLSGSVTFTDEDGSERFPYAGTIKGRVTDSGGSGRLSGANAHDSESGRWSAQ